MPGQARQPSFGGVAQLFGDSDAADEPSKPKARQSSFGGVASLFGDDDDAGAVTGPSSSAAAGRRAPSFGGVANLFGGHDEEPPKVGAAVTGGSGGSGRAGRQASFGGVAALFGDEDEEVPDRINTKPKKSGARQASFGGVAALFGEDDGAGPAAGPPPPAASKQPAAGKPAGKSKKRDPSFSGVANLFGDEDEEDDKGPETENFQTDTIAPLQNIPKTGARTKKRDPSFGGVAGLFADNDDDDEEEEEELNITFKTTVNSKLTTDLQIQVENEREKVVELEGDLAKATKANDDLETRIRELENEITSLTQSKMILIQQTSQEIDRMRELIQLSFTDQASKAKAATVG